MADLYKYLNQSGFLVVLELLMSLLVFYIRIMSVPGASVAYV
jgi:hypothetical protein